MLFFFFFFFSSRRRHTRFDCDWSSDVCSSDLRARHLDGLRQARGPAPGAERFHPGLARRLRRLGHPDPVAYLIETRSPRLKVKNEDRKSTRLNSSHSQISYAVFCLKKKKKDNDSDVVQYCE